MSESGVVLAVDLDGTLHDRDVSVMDFLRATRQRPWVPFVCIAWWMTGGRARIKTALAASSTLQLTDLRFDERIVSWLRQERASGRIIVLATGTDEALAERLVRPLGLFDSVLGTSSDCNLVGHAKAQRLIDQYGVRGFDYAGNSTADLLVWPHCRRAIVVNAKPSIRRRASEISQVDRVFDPP